MERAQRLRLIGKVCYYLGWAALILAVIWHLGRLELSVHTFARLSGQNLLEGCVALFVASIASEARALGIGPK